MTATFDFDRLLSSVLDLQGPQTVPSTLVEAALTRSREVPQRRPLVRALDRRAWPSNRLSLGFPPSLVSTRWPRVLILALIAIALVAVGVVGLGALQDVRTPKATVSGFVRPFEYVIPVDSAIRESGSPIREMVAWVEGPGVWPSPAPENVNGGQRPAPWEVRGVIVGSGEEAWSHGTDGRFMLRTTPSEFLADLRDVASVPMGAITETTLDGRPALTVLLPGTGGTDIHVTGRMQGLIGNYALVTMPSRLIVAEIDGTTVFILIWARTADDLGAWMPVADAFVASIHFVPEDQP